MQKSYIAATIPSSLVIAKLTTRPLGMRATPEFPEDPSGVPSGEIRTSLWPQMTRIFPFGRASTLPASQDSGSGHDLDTTRPPEPNDESREAVAAPALLPPRGPATASYATYRSPRELEDASSSSSRSPSTPRVPRLHALPVLSSVQLRGELSLERTAPDPQHSRNIPEKKRAPSGARWQEEPGGALLSHGLPPAVPLALAGLTSVFGMGTGVSPPLWPPETCRHSDPRELHSEHEASKAKPSAY